MNKIDELRQAAAAMADSIRALISEDKLEEAKTKKAELDAIREKIQMLAQLDAEAKGSLGGEGITGYHKPDEPESGVKALAGAARKGFKVSAALNEGTPADGGYTVPEDIQTQIEHYRQSADALETLISVVGVKTLTGERTFVKRSTHTGFAKVSEGGTIPTNSAAQFERKSYSVEKYGGLYYATNELLADTDANIASTLIEWISAESRTTRNKLIVAQLETAAPVAIADADDIKDILNVTLDPAFGAYTKIVTNQEGWNWLDKLTDADGRYLLQPDVTNPTVYRLFGKEVVKINSADLPVVKKTTGEGESASTTTYAPFFIGDLKEAAVLFDRKRITIDSSNVAADAWATDQTVWRALERLDVIGKDDKAYVYGQLSLT